jgi:hypothetical protein
LKFFSKICTLTFTFFLIIGCTSPEYDAAIDSYREAKASHLLKPLVVALKKLSKLNPEKFQNELNIAKNAQVKLKEAESYLLNNEFLLAYLASHDSYRTLFSFESQAILIQSGKSFLPIFQAHKNFEYLLEDHFNRLSQEIENYRQSPVQEWDLVALNQLLIRLSESDKALKDSLIVIKNQQLYLSIQGLVGWQSSIENQHKIVKQTLDYLISLARYRSANLLLTLNRILAEKSRKLLSIYRVAESAKYNMQHYFVKAQQQYYPYKILVENVSLATQLSQKDIHASWYVKWNELESFILEPKGLFEYYPQSAEGRAEQIHQLLRDNNLNPPDLAQLSINDNFKEKHPTIYSLIEKLKKDYALLI